MTQVHKYIYKILLCKKNIGEQIAVEHSTKICLFKVLKESKKCIPITEVWPLLWPHKRSTHRKSVSTLDAPFHTFKITKT